MSDVPARLYTYDAGAETWRNPQGEPCDHPLASDEWAVGNICVMHSTYNDGRCGAGWTNCDGDHLFAVLPSGNVFDYMSRAANCGLPEDTEHRCWVVHGLGTDKPHVDKSGVTCAAGAGSVIDNGPLCNWHGFLHDGVMTSC